MSDVEANVAMLQEAYRRYATEGIEPVLERLTDDVEWCSVGPGALPWCGNYRGRDGVATFYERLNDSVVLQAYEVHRIIAQGEWVVALATAKVMFKASGRTEQFEKADVFHMREGRIAEFREYFDSAKAMEALGSGSRNERTG